MTTDEIKDLLYRCFALGFEAGTFSGNPHEMKAYWEGYKYAFEKDLEKQAEKQCYSK